MAAGEGRRLRPLTERWPKPILPIDGKPVIATLLRELAGAGIGDGHRGHRPPRRAGRGARRRRLGLRHLRGLRAPAGAARLGRRRPARARRRRVRTAPRGGRRHGVPARRCRPRVQGVAGLGDVGRPGRPPRRQRGEDAGAGRGRACRRNRRRPRQADRRTAVVLRRRASCPGSRICQARRSSSRLRFADDAGTGIDVLALDVGPTRDLTRPEDVVVENFPYLWRSG